MSTRLTYKNLSLAQEALRDLANDIGEEENSCPALGLTDLCLELSSKALASRSDAEPGTLEWRIKLLLEQAVDLEPGERRIRFALATLHFVERVLGFTVHRKDSCQRARLSMEGARRRGRACGTYGTPDFITETMVKDIVEVLTKDRKRSASILDLSVEAGQFPVTFLEQTVASVPAMEFYGLDRDRNALRIAERIIRFARRTRVGSGFEFHSSCQDSLLDPLPSSWPKSFFAVVGNPPWKLIGATEGKRIQERFPNWLNEGQYDIYQAFIARADSLLVPGGYLSYVVPSAFLFNCGSTRVRQLLLDHYDIINLRLYPQGSFVEISSLIPVSFLAKKRAVITRCPPVARVEYHPTSLGGSDRPRTSHIIRPALWRKLPGCVFHPCVTPANRFLITDLAGEPLARWGTLIGGPHLGSARRYKAPSNFKGIHARHIRAFHVCFRRVPRYSKAIARFERPPDLLWIRAHKVVIQEIRYPTHRDRLVAASASSGTCAVSTAMMFFPHQEDHCDFFVALLNSHVANAWYKLRDVSRSIKLAYLRELPVPFDGNCWRRITELSRQCRLQRMDFHNRLALCTFSNEQMHLAKRFGNKFKSFIECRAEIEEQVFDLYNLSSDRREAVCKLSASRVF